MRLPTFCSNKKVKCFVWFNRHEIFGVGGRDSLSASWRCILTLVGSIDNGPYSVRNTRMSRLNLVKMAPSCNCLEEFLRDPVKTCSWQVRNIKGRRSQRRWLGVCKPMMVRSCRSGRNHLGTCDHRPQKTFANP